PDQVRAWLQTSQLLAAPSVVTRAGDAEGLPVTIMEALATGWPVGGFPSGGSADGIRDGGAGCLVAPGDVAGLTGAIARALTGDSLRSRMSAAARPLAAEHFSIASQTAELERIYDAVVARHRARP